MSPERVPQDVFMEFMLQEAADELISETQRDLLEEHQCRVKQLLEDVSIFYPQGIPDEIFDAINDEVTIALPGSLDAIGAWLDIQDKLREHEKLQRIQ